MQSENDESWLTGWEQQCIEAVQNETDYEEVLNSQTDTVQRNVWSAFQDSATAVAQLYRERHTDVTGALWVPFQTAAGTVTSLYKESSDGIRRTGEVALQCGYQKRTRDIMNWARKRRRTIRREDLLAYLAGKPPPPRAATHRCSPKPCTLSTQPETLPLSQLGPVISPVATTLGPDAELHTFREALAMSSLSGRRARHGPELYAFVTGEIARHCKRPASPGDVNMESPTHHSKRVRFM
ncbi:UPF0472 protein C16orf72 homolog [Ctenocephalides felis]|uniref:UPF0472 protein C16orf72 homolog n=1 Tax=Ctenocephalides felis TaxID=7515 RepID=UPI000E6E1F24|nr:UPF0472 protein C16orf72 homolog [Ctenocephalides felis]